MIVKVTKFAKKEGVKMHAGFILVAGELNVLLAITLQNVSAYPSIKEIQQLSV